MRPSRLTPSDREAIATAHAEGAKRALFGRLDFVSDDQRDDAAIYSPSAKRSDAPALVVTNETIGSVDLITQRAGMTARAAVLG
jgi:hypothetical protein